VNKRLIEQGIRRFIADSLPCVPLLGVSSTHLENTSFQPTHHKAQRNHVVLRLLAEGSVVVVVVALGWWGMANLGSYSLASQSDSLTAQRAPIYVAGCPVPVPLEKSSRRGGVGQRRGCSHEGATHPITSRQPGVGLGGQAHGAERHRDDRVPPRTSENSPTSTTSLTTGEPAEKSNIEWFLEGKSRSVGPILSLLDSNSRNIQLHILLI
jgi:hypothetical protein